jgi:bacillithiol biosynthesis cysteine-adding enzyme BshC
MLGREQPADPDRGKGRRMIISLDPQHIPAATTGPLYLDYIEGRGKARPFFPYGPHDLRAALEARGAHTYPRAAVVPLLRAYNSSLGASRRALANIDALADEGTMCVIAGQQAGFLGGPAYTCHKIATTIRLAAEIEASFGVRCVPLFWLASEDHDLGEINHAYLAQSDGEIGHVGFGWSDEGKPIAALPVGERVMRAFDTYWAHASPGPYLAETREQFAPRGGEDYASWNARLWSELFAAHGLVLVEPRVIRPPAGDLFSRVLRLSAEIQHRLNAVSRQLGEAGYTPQLQSESAGQLYTFDERGYRVRVSDPERHVRESAVCPERYSTDAALRPLFADAMLPIVASVLGPGETAYHGMLGPLYELLGLPQPHVFPRKSYTLVAAEEAERIAAYGVTVQQLLCERVSVDAAIEELVPSGERELFEVAERAGTAALEPLWAYVRSIDSGLGRTMVQHVARTQRSLVQLRERAFHSRLRQLGYSRGELRALRNVLLPRDRLQERVLPLPHFLMRHGRALLDTLMEAGDLQDYRHDILILDEGYA